MNTVRAQDFSTAIVTRAEGSVTLTLDRFAAGLPDVQLVLSAPNARFLAENLLRASEALRVAIVPIPVPEALVA